MEPAGAGEVGLDDTEPIVRGATARGRSVAGPRRTGRQARTFDSRPAEGAPARRRQHSARRDAPDGGSDRVGYVRGVSERADLARRAIGLIDLTDLSDDHSPDGIDELCRRAREHGTAAVCVWPEYVARCAELLDGSAVRVATVVNFPSGGEPVVDVVATTHRALAAGADDIDLVLPYEAFLEGDSDRAGAMVAAIAVLIETPRLLKVILESGAYPGVEAVAAAARLAIANGADFVKTSTGKIAEGASLDAAAAMLGEIAGAAEAGRTVGLKPSGGIRSFDDAMAYLDLADGVMGEGWATPATFRYGASGVLDALLAECDGTTPPASGSSY